MNDAEVLDSLAVQKLLQSSDLTGILLSLLGLLGLTGSLSHSKVEMKLRRRTIDYAAFATGDGAALDLAAIFLRFK